MAELEAITDIRPTKEKPHAVPAQYGRRFPLVQVNRSGWAGTKPRWTGPSPKMTKSLGFMPI